MGTIRIRRPTAAPAAPAGAPTFLVGGPVTGLCAGIRTDTAWRSWQCIATVWDGRLREDGATVVSVETHGMVGAAGFDDRTHIDEMAATVDFAIVGLGTCGSCTSFTVADAVTIEKHAKPVLAIVTEEFATLAHTMAEHLGHRDLKVLVLPYPLEARPTAELDAIAHEFYPRALAALGAKA
ncbi:MAG: UGSC family (seleno)protein [Actinomycetota bacterium]